MIARDHLPVIGWRAFALACFLLAGTIMAEAAHGANTINQRVAICDPVTAANCQNFVLLGNGQSAAIEIPADATNGNNTTLTAGSVTNGLFNAGTVVNPTTNQVVLGPIDTTDFGSWAFYQNVSIGSGVVLTVQESEDGTNFVALAGQNGGTSQSGLQTAFPSGGGLFSGPVKHRYIRLIVTTGGTETFTVIGYLRAVPFVNTTDKPLIYCSVATGTLSSFSGGTANSPKCSGAGYLITQPYAPYELEWQGSTNGTPITTATTTQLQAAQGAGIRNYLSAMICDNSNATVGEVQILDGATVIADRFIPANATNFDVMKTGGVPLKGSTATAMNFKTFATQSLYCSWQGFQGD
jgi:hypothetical protein